MKKYLPEMHFSWFLEEVISFPCKLFIINSTLSHSQNMILIFFFFSFCYWIEHFGFKMGSLNVPT